MFSTTKKTLVTLAILGAAAAGGASLAGAATSTTTTADPGATTTTEQHDGPGRGRADELTGTIADKVKAAALAKVPGGTVLRVEAGHPGESAYEAHVRKADGTEVEVLVNATFEATAVQTRPADGPGGAGHPGGKDCPGGGHGHGGPGGPGRPNDNDADDAATGSGTTTTPAPSTSSSAT
jgi:uncharacterized membrane protein YkoI